MYLSELFLELISHDFVCFISSDAPVSELSLELLLLQVVLPALLEQGHTRMWLKGMVRGWTLGMAYVLGLRSYLLGDVPIDNTVSFLNSHGVYYLLFSCSKFL